MLTHKFQIILNFLYVCQSVICLTYLLILHKYRDNSSSGWDIFLKFLGDILGMLDTSSKQFWIYCMSVCWLTSLLNLDKYRHISGSEWYIFLKIFEDIPEMFFHHVLIILNFLYVCQSVSWHTSLLK